MEAGLEKGREGGEQPYSREPLRWSQQGSGDQRGMRRDVWERGGWQPLGLAGCTDSHNEVPDSKEREVTTFELREGHLGTCMEHEWPAQKQQTFVRKGLCKVQVKGGGSRLHRWGRVSGTGNIAKTVLAYW